MISDQAPRSSAPWTEMGLKQSEARRSESKGGAMGSRVKLVFMVVALMASACRYGTAAEDRPAPAVKGTSQAGESVRLMDGGSIRLGESDALLRGSLSAHGDSWLTDSRQNLYVGTSGGRVVAIAAFQGTVRFPIHGFRFGASFEALQRESPALRPTIVGERPGLLLDGSQARTYLLSAPGYDCQHRPLATQIAIVSHGFDSMLEELIVGQGCRTPAPDLKIET